MIEVNKIKIQLIDIWKCVVVITLASIVTAQQAQPYQYPSPYQNAFNEDRRSYSGYRAASLSPNNGETVKFPDDHFSSISATHGFGNQNTFIGRHKKDMSRNDRSNEDSFVPINVTYGINSYDDFESLLDEESQKWYNEISPRSGFFDERKLVETPKPANCVPEMTVVPLKLADESDAKDPTILVFPPCTRVMRCGGCCTSNLLSCQPVEKNYTNFQVFKSQYQGGKLKLLNKEVVIVEQHTRCKCDCRKKESDCTKFQRYYKDQCMCICINIEDKNKCLQESGEKIWDPESCSCRCRGTKECSSGTYFDENSCSCQETPGRRHTDIVADRRRLIKKPVIYVPETPETYYDSGT